jgi:cupin 2 domain-containing protein
MDRGQRPGARKALMGRLQPASAAPEHGESERTLVELPGFSVRQVLSGQLERPVAYLQEEDEWALVISGRAALVVGVEAVELEPGDWVWLPAGVAHTLERAEPGTSWVTVHLRAASSPRAAQLP